METVPKVLHGLRGITKEIHFSRKSLKQVLLPGLTDPGIHESDSPVILDEIKSGFTPPFPFLQDFTQIPCVTL
jgi:hypothetical protein